MPGPEILDFSLTLVYLTRVQMRRNSERGGIDLNFFLDDIEFPICFSVPFPPRGLASADSLRKFFLLFFPKEKLFS